MQGQRNGCPVCGKPVDRDNRPFCSVRCKMVDLSRWLDGSYRLPGEDTPASGEVIEFTSRESRNGHGDPTL